MDLSGYSTQQLLDMLLSFQIAESAQKDYGELLDLEFYTRSHTVSTRAAAAFIHLEVGFVTKDQVKAELATRPHIPNKAERKEARRQKQQEKQNR